LSSAVPWTRSSGRSSFGASGKSDAIAFVAVRFAAPVVASVLDGLEQRAFALSRYVRGIRPYSTFNQLSAKEEILREILYARKAEAVIMLTVKPSAEMAEEYKKRGVPLVLIENDMAGTHSIRVDNERGAYRATEALIKKGRKKIALFNGVTKPRPGEDLNLPALERLQGYKAALKKHRIPFDESRVVVVRNVEGEEGAHAFEQCLRKKLKFDAIFCAAGDAVAIGIMEAARYAKVRIPEDLSLIGFDDAPAASLLSPALSSVHQEFKELGSMAFDMAVDAIEGRLRSDKKILIDPELILRESV